MQVIGAATRKNHEAGCVTQVDTTQARGSKAGIPATRMSRLSSRASLWWTSTAAMGHTMDEGDGGGEIARFGATM